jgi:hypothetical protein
VRGKRKAPEVNASQLREKEKLERGRERSRA